MRQKFKVLCALVWVIAVTEATPFNLKPTCTFQMLTPEERTILTHKLTYQATAYWPTMKSMLASEKPENLKAASENLKQKLDESLFFLREIFNAENVSKEQREKLKQILRIFYNRQLLKNTGFRLEGDPTVQPVIKIRGWIQSDQMLAYWANRFAEKREVRSLTVRLPRIDQDIENDYFVWEEHFLEANDKNRLAWYVEIALGCLEEYYHVVTFGRMLSGVMDQGANLSDWAHAQFQGSILDLEADVYQYFREQLGPLPSYWKERYDTRLLVHAISE